MSKTQALRDLYRALQTAEISNEIRMLLEKKISILESEREDDKMLISRLQNENQELKEKLSNLDPTGFVESEGLLWKKRPDGEIEDSPYCPECNSHPVMHTFPPRGISKPHLWKCPNSHSFSYIKEPKF